MLPAILIIASIFAFLIYRLASAHFKNKLRPEASDYGADPHTAALAGELNRAFHGGEVTQGER